MARKKIILLIVVLFSGFLTTACTVTSKPVIDSDLRTTTKNKGLPDKLLVLPPEATVHEISAGGVVEEVPEWSEQAKVSLEKAVSQFFSGTRSERITEMPELTPQDDRLIREHMLLYDVVAGSAYLATNMPQYGWSHKISEFDYTVGPGLRFLKEQTGADAALFIVGADFISSGGRIAMITMAALVGVGMPVGQSYLQAGVVDLETGDILWFNNCRAIGNRDLRDPDDAYAMLTDMFAEYRR